MAAARARRSVGALLALLLFVGLGALGAPSLTPRASGQTVTTALAGHLSGPTTVGVGLKANYVVNATGGPAIAANGTQVGNLTYQASIVGFNTTSASISPSQGVLINDTATLNLVAPNLTETLTLYVDVGSSYNGDNQSTNLTYVINIIQPIVLSASLTVVGPSSVKAFSITVELDGAAVGVVNVPSLTAGQSYPLTFSYVGAGLSAGWHTFTISLAQEHGDVVFAGGSESYSASFYVPGPAPDNTLWILAGAVALAGAVFIWATRVGGRRRSKAKR